MVNINYEKLNKQLFNAVANNSGAEAVPEMKHVIQNYLDKFSSSLRQSVFDLDVKSNKDKAVLKNLAGIEYKDIQAIGKNEVRELNRLIHSNFTPQKISAIVTKDFQTQIAQVVHSSVPQIQRYRSAVRENTQKVNNLTTKVKKLSQGLNEANARMKNTQGKTATIIGVTITVTACVCYLFL